jgi:RNA-directed DNA polymerase
MVNDESARISAGRGRWRMGPYYLGRRAMPAEGRGPDLRQARKVMRSRRLANGPATPLERVQKLQTSLQAKAKAEPDFRFYSLWDKVCRADVLEEAYRACRRNDGASGCDGMTFDQITAYGQDRWLEELRQELRAGDYRPQPLLRVWIPKSNGGQRPLGIPCIRDRVVEMAALLVLGPIFEADLLRNQYGFRPEMDAKMAVRQAFWHVSDHGRTEVVDADLSDYFSSIPHGPLMRCVSRRVADGTLLSVIKRWLTAPVIEHDNGTTRCTTEAKDRHRGTPQGSPISPLLANLYFRRFLLAWERFDHRKRLDAYVVNYADDRVPRRCWRKLQHRTA